jgi:hypothetical protein
VQALKVIGVERKSVLVDEIADVDLSELMSISNWQDCLCSVFERLWSPGGPSILELPERSYVLERWLKKVERPGWRQLRFADVVLYYLVRRMPRGHSVRDRWIQRCVELAEATQDDSLVESLLYTLREEAGRFPPVALLARKLSGTSPVVAKAWRRTGAKVEPIE